MQQRTTPADWLVFVGLGLAWGTAYVFIKLGIETLGTFTLIAGRLGIGLALLAGVVAFSRDALPRDPRVYRHIAVMSVLSISLPFTLITSAEHLVDSTMAAILNGTVPLFAIVIAALVLHDEPLTVGRVVGLVVGYGGSVGVGGRAPAGAVPPDLTGEILLLLSAVCYGLGAVYARRNVRGVRPMHIAAIQVAFAFVTTGVIAVLLERPWTEAWPPSSILAVLWLGIIGSGLAYLANFRLLYRLGAGRTSLVAYLLPVVGIVAGGLVFGETVGPRVLAGTALVIGGVAIVNSRFGSRTLLGRAAPSGDRAPAGAGAAAARTADPEPIVEAELEPR
jgi:drug/metabolite transporter (DMT)-like permease